MKRLIKNTSNSIIFWYSLLILFLLISWIINPSIGIIIQVIGSLIVFGYTFFDESDLIDIIELDINKSNFWLILFISGWIMIILILLGYNIIWIIKFINKKLDE